MFARRRGHRFDARFQLGQPFGFKLQSFAIARQRMHRFRQLNAGGFQQVSRLLEGLVVIRERPQPRRSFVDLRRNGRLVFIQDGQRRARAFQQAGGMRQTPLFLIVFLPAHRLEGQRAQFLHLPVEHFLFARHRRDILLGSCASVTQLSPGPKFLRRLRCEGRGANLRIQQRTLRVTAQQGVIGVLAMDISQKLARLAQLSQRRRRSIDARPRPSGGINHPAQQAGIVSIKIVFFQPGRQFAANGNIEFSRDLGAFGACADYGGIRPFAKRQRQCIDQDGFAGPGLAGQRPETRLELKLKAINDHKIPDDQTAQHVIAWVIRSNAAFLAAWRSNYGPGDATASRTSTTAGY